MITSFLDDETLPQVESRPLASLLVAPENDEIYGAISLDHPDIRELARSIKEHGIQEPIVITDGNWKPSYRNTS